MNGYSGSVLMTVFLVTECGEPHLHSITGPGSTKTVCKEVTLDGNIPAIQTVIGPEQNMTAVYVLSSSTANFYWFMSFYAFAFFDYILGL